MAEEKLDRSDFFRLGRNKAAKAAVDIAEARAEQRAKRYIRPPFALRELDFLIKCTRCGDCIEACPHEVIFPLSARLGIEIVSTPALDLANDDCRLCKDWPCVTACKPGALQLPEPDNPEEDEEKSAILGPRLAEAIIDPRHCLPYLGPECGICGSVCPVPGAIEWEGSRPKINSDVCTGCALCRVACITEPKAIAITPISAAQMAGGAVSAKSPGHSN